MKNLVNFILIYLLFLYYPLIACGTTISGAIQNGNVFNVTPSHFSSNGTTGFRQYSNFSVDQNHIVNLEFQNNMNKFVNIVNNEVTINGILNTVKNGNFYNGNVIFITKGGFTVGESGVLNVGSLNVYARNIANPDIETLSKLTDEALKNELTTYKKTCKAPITINGKILALDDVNLYTNNLTHSKDSSIIAGLDDSKIQNGNTQSGIAKEITSEKALNKAISISNIVNTGNLGELKNNYAFALNKGKIHIVSENINLQGNIKSGGDIEIEQNGNNFNISGKISTQTNLKLQSQSKFDINIQDTANLYACEELNIIHNGTGRINISNGTVLNGYDININQAKGTNLEILGQIKAENNINITKSDDYSIYINNALSAGSDININNKGTGQILLKEMGILKANNVSLTQNQGGNLEVLGEIEASNDIIIKKAGGSTIYINNALSAGSEIVINHKSLGQIALAKAGSLNAKNVSLIQNQGGNLEVLGEIEASKDIIIKKGGGNTIYINNSIKAGNDLNITHNGIGQISLQSAGSLDGKNINITQGGGNLDLGGTIEAINDINITKSGNNQLIVRKNLKAGNDVNITQNANGNLDIQGMIEASNDINITKRGNNKLLIKNNLIAGNDVNITQEQGSNIEISKEVKADKNIKITNNGSSSLILNGNIESNNIEFISQSTGNITVNGAITADKAIDIQKDNAGRVILTNNSNLKAKEVNINQTTAEELTINGKINTSKNISLEHLGESSGIKINGNADINTSGNFKINTTSGIIVSDADIGANNFEINNSSQNVTSINSNSDINIKNNFIINNTGSGSVSIDNSDVTVNGKFIINANNSISIKNANIAVFNGTKLNSDKNIDIINNNNKNLNINNAQISANNDISIINNGKGNIEFKNGSSLTSSQGNVSIINKDNAGYIKLDGGDIHAMEQINIEHPIAENIYIVGHFKLLADGSVKFVPNINLTNKHGKYNLQKYSNILSQNSLIILTPEMLKSIGIETKKIFNEKKMFEKISIDDLFKISNLSKQDKTEHIKNINFSLDLDLNDIFKKNWIEKNYEIK